MFDAIRQSVLRSFALLSLSIFANACSSDTDIIFRGICDGSAAVQYARESLLIAYDESNSLYAFSVAGGEPLARMDLESLLDLPDSGEMDLEAVTLLGQQLWWIGSHSLNKKGRIAENRRLLFATNIPSTDLHDLEITHQPVDLLVIIKNSALVSRYFSKRVLDRLPKKGGVNIEGLATDIDGNLLLGFRSPLTGKKGLAGDAIIIRLRPVEYSFEVVAVEFLDLENRGVRDIAKHGSRYRIIAGPVSGGKVGFALYDWDGKNQLEQLRQINGLNAEAIVNTGNGWLLLSDDGSEKREDTEAKDGDRTCNRIRRKNSQGEQHPGVYFRAVKINEL
ncbi:MAG: DUF3616 domain-containing protein [Gammaproteobacteria bacterium]